MPSTEDPEQQSSPSGSCSDAPQSRVSVIQFVETLEGDEDAEEAAAEKRVWRGGDSGRYASIPPLPDPFPASVPHPCPHGRAYSVGPHLTPVSSR